MLKTSQTGASALLGFLQSLQQGQTQRSQQRDQYLQQDIQRFDADRAYNLQKQQSDIAKAQADRAVVLANREDEAYNKAAPVRELELTTALGKPDADANARVALYEQERTQKEGERAGAVAKISSTRDTATRAQLATQIQQLDETIAGLEGRLTGDLRTIPGLKDPSGYITRFKTRGKSLTPGTTGGLQTTTQGTEKVEPVKIRDTDFGVPAVTGEDRDALVKSVAGYGLGALTSDYFGMPSASFEQRDVTDFKGKKYKATYGKVLPPSQVGVDMTRFIQERMPDIQAALQVGLQAGETRKLKPEESLTQILGGDKSIWPLDIDDKGNVTQKVDFWKNLSADQRLRLSSRLREYIKPDETVISQVEAARKARTTSLEGQIENFKEERDPEFIRLEKIYEESEAYRRQNLVATNKTAGSTEEYKSASENFQTQRQNVTAFIASDKTVSNQLSTAKVDVEAVLLGTGAPTAAGVQSKWLGFFFNTRAQKANALVVPILRTAAKNIVEFDAKSGALADIQAKATTLAINATAKEYYVKNGFAPDGTAVAGTVYTPQQMKEKEALVSWLKSFK